MKYTKKEIRLFRTINLVAVVIGLLILLFLSKAVGMVIIGLSLFFLFRPFSDDERAEFSDLVSEYKIVKKYEEGLPWAILLVLEDGSETWNKTIPGSFCARDPENDLTFVFSSAEDALRHAQDIFPNAIHRK
ncbi:MAG: hypothetical protein ACL93V_14330 [Candidatus Electrothrix sp. YB6]